MGTGAVCITWELPLSLFLPWRVFELPLNGGCYACGYYCASMLIEALLCPSLAESTRSLAFMLSWLALKLAFDR